MSKSAGDSLNDRSAPDIKLLPHLQGPASDALNLFGAEERHDLAPLPDRRVADTERPRDIRRLLEVIENVSFEHVTHSTIVERRLQPHDKTNKLTLVVMKHDHSTLAGRLADAMGTDISQSDLARSCNVSPAAVGKWLNGSTKKLSAQALVDAARALGVSQDWLRTGKLPRERRSDIEGQQTDRVIALLEDLQEPLSKLAVAIQELKKAREVTDKKRPIA